MEEDLVEFVMESNKIEGIYRDVHEMRFISEVDAHVKLLTSLVLTVSILETFVEVIQPGNVLRRKVGQDVRVGNYLAPAGGPDIEIGLNNILLDTIPTGPYRGSAYDTHLAYEKLHPFTDGNGRSGRAIWLWQRQGFAPLGFLHQFYYQTLEKSGKMI